MSGEALWRRLLLFLLPEARGAQDVDDAVIAFVAGVFVDGADGAGEGNSASQGCL